MDHVSGGQAEPHGSLSEMLREKFKMRSDEFILRL